MREFCEWRAAYRIEPWGDWRDDLRIGKLAAAVVAQLVHKSQKPGDFMPHFEQAPERKTRSVDELKQEFAKAKGLIDRLTTKPGLPNG